MSAVSINKKEKLSQHFTLGEMTKTSYKTADGNIPSNVAIENLKRLCSWLEMLRSEYNRRYVCLSAAPDAVPEPVEGPHDEEPIIINSAYRSWEVNKRAGGSPTSNHLVGCAADIKCFGIEQALSYAVILLDISDESREDFDELLLERSPRGNYWIHFAVRPPSQKNRRKIRFIQT